MCIKEHKDKLFIRTVCMHKAEETHLEDWALRRNLARSTDGEPLAKGKLEGKEPSESVIPELPQEILDGHGEDGKCERVENWTGLLDDDSSKTHLACLKSRATLAMQLVLDAVTDKPGEEDLEIIHRFNKAGVAKTEVWTKKEFKEKELVIPPWSSDIKDRLYTTNLSAHLHIGREHVPGQRLLALDGRGRSHLAHQDERAHIKGEVGNLFWLVGRTSDPKIANMHMAFTKVSIPKYTVQLPTESTATTKSIVQAHIPQVPVMYNRKSLAKHTRLLVQHDTIVENLRADEQAAAKEEKDKKGKPTAETHPDDKETNERMDTGEKDKKGRPKAETHLDGKGTKEKKDTGAPPAKRHKPGSGN